MKIKLHPTGQEIEGDPNKSLLQICMDNKVEIRSICKGVPSCAECRVKILAGEHNLIPPNKAELNLIGTSYYLDGRRLACQVRAFGDISVDITDHLKEDDSTNKKIRGFRAQPGHNHQSRAVQGTLVLQEGPKPQERRETPSPRPPRDENSAADEAGEGRGAGEPRGSNENRSGEPGSRTEGSRTEKRDQRDQRDQRGGRDQRRRRRR